MYYHLKTSIIGSHANIQDSIGYFENEDKIISVVADGLGSRKYSADGARLICKLVVEELKLKRYPLSSEEVISPIKWYKYLKQNNSDFDDFCTTCSFAFVDKKAKGISIGQIGDSPVFIRVDNNSVLEMRQEKEFSNITDCLGGKTIKSFSVHNYEFRDKINVLVTSDGIGDELQSSSLESLFNFLCNKYQKFSPKARSRQFTKEIKATIGKVNNDDKSAIYIWSI